MQKSAWRQAPGILFCIQTSEFCIQFMEIRELNANDVSAAMDDLTALLCDAVASGASVGFLPPLNREESRAYWQTVLPSLQDKSRVLLAAFVDGALVGAVQLGLEGRANGSHRAEVMKLLVHTSHRRKGIGRALMLALEDRARQLGRTTLVLDTRAGDPSQTLYESLGYTLLGVIPQYARSANGQLHGTAFMYRLLSDS